MSSDGGGGVLFGVRSWLGAHRRHIIRIAVSLALVFAILLVLRQSWLWAGPVATIVYSLLFVVGLTLLPMTVLLLRDMAPNFIGKFEFVLGQLAFGRGWLVQHDREWRMHPGRERDGREEVYIDGQWHEVGDTQNQTILGWQPFGFIMNKDAATLADSRVDVQAEVVDDRATRSDGGREAVVRGGVEQVPLREAVDIDPDPNVDPDRWVLDLKQYWSAGLEQMGDITLIEKVEEITMRDEALNERSERKGMLVGSIVGLILGAATGYVTMAGF